MDRYTLLYLKRITKKDLLYGTENSAQCYVAAWMAGQPGGTWIHCYIENEQSTRTYCTAQGTLLSVMWQPGWERGLGENGHMCIRLSPFAVHRKRSQHCLLIGYTPRNTCIPVVDSF